MRNGCTTTKIFCRPNCPPGSRTRPEHRAAFHTIMVVTIDSPVGLPKIPGIPYKLSKTPAQIRMAPPTQGQHTDEIMASIGFTPDEIEQAKQDGAV